MTATNEVIETHLDDLQSEMEFAKRKADTIGELLLETQLRQASALGALVRKVADLRASILQQRETLRLLRAEIRARLR